MIIPPHLVVLGLKFAAARIAHKGVEAGIDIAAREYARHMTAEGADPAKTERQAKTAARRTRQVARAARMIKPALRAKT